MFDDSKVVWCRNCEYSVFPWETHPWGTCCEESKNKQTICKTVARCCNKFNRKEKENGKDKQRGNNEVMQGH